MFSLSADGTFSVFQRPETSFISFLFFCCLFSSSTSVYRLLSHLPSVSLFGLLISLIKTIYSVNFYFLPVVFLPPILIFLLISSSFPINFILSCRDTDVLGLSPYSFNVVFYWRVHRWFICGLVSNCLSTYRRTILSPPCSRPSRVLALWTFSSFTFIIEAWIYIASWRCCSFENAILTMFSSWSWEYPHI